MMSVVRIEAILNNGGKATGSGFAYSFAQQEDGMYVPAIVTNKHVIEGAVSVSLPISTADNDGNPTGTFEVITYPLHNNDIYHPNSEVDLCAILAGPIYQYFQNKNTQPLLFRLDKNIAAT